MSSPLSSSRRHADLWSFPQELIERTLTFCHPSDVAAFARTCKTAHPVVYGAGDQYLWRSLFLNYPFDDPRHAVEHVNANAVTFDWRGELQRRVAAEQWATGGNPLLEEDAIRAFSEVLDQARPGEPPQNWEELAEHATSHNLRWLVTVFGLEEGESTHKALSRSNRQWSYQSRIGQLGGRLRAYHALSRDGLGPWVEDIRATIRPSTLQKLNSIRSKSRADVYSLTSYTDENMYGPYLPFAPDIKDHPVNWWQVDAIVNVIILNVRDCCRQMFANPTNSVDDLTVGIRPPMGLCATRAYTAPKSLTDVPGDWAGITGTWRRYVCFMDYRSVRRHICTSLWG